MPEVKVPFYGHAEQYRGIRREIDEAIRTVLESGAYVLGPALKRFETDLAAYFGLNHAVGVNSGTDALWLAFLALGLKPGDEVIAPANTFFATAEAIWIAGGTVVFADCDPVTRTLDPARIEAAVTSRTVGIVPVHLYGLCADMEAIAGIAKRKGLWVVEDNAQAIDGHGPGWRQGQYSEAVCTSFMERKNLGTPGDAGAVVTNRGDLDRSVRELRNHGSSARSVHRPGFNSRLDDLHAAILGVKLKHITAWTDRRREIAARYGKGLKGTSLTLPTEPPGVRHVYHLFVVEHPERGDLEKFLLNAGIEVKLHYPIAIHRQEGYPWSKPVGPNPRLPNCEKNAAQCLSLPLHPELTDEQVDTVIEKCVEWDRKP